MSVRCSPNLPISDLSRFPSPYVTITRTDGLWSQTYSGLAVLANIALPATATARAFTVTAWLDAVGAGVFAAPDRAATVYANDSCARTVCRGRVKEGQVEASHRHSDTGFD